MVKVQILPCKPNFKPLRKAHPSDAGYDLCYVPKDPDDERNFGTLNRGLFPCGFHIAIPEGYEGQVRPRSGLALEYGIIIPNAPGTIDSGYRGEVQVMLMNLGSVPCKIKPGDRIAQLVIQKIPDVEMEIVSSLDETARGEGGFGSTGMEAFIEPEGTVHEEEEEDEDLAAREERREREAAEAAPLEEAAE